MPQTNTYNPEIWMESLTRCLKEYVETGFDEAVLDDMNNPVGLQVYTVIMEFPSTEKIISMLPSKQTVVHLEIDDITNRPLGFGKPISNYNYDAIAQEMKPQEVKQHVVNFDLGIWAYDKSGGTTARLRALEILTDLFQGWKAQQRMDEAVDVGDGRIEILMFEGGRFITDKINDIDVYRTVNSSMDVRVFSRDALPDDAQAVPTIESAIQDENLTIPV